MCSKLKSIEALKSDYEAKTAEIATKNDGLVSVQEIEELEAQYKKQLEKIKVFITVPWSFNVCMLRPMCVVLKLFICEVSW